MRPIPMEKEFYERDTLLVAHDLLGKMIVRKMNGKRLIARIVETEAYIGAHDPAAHSFGRITKRNKVMFGPAGISYVYFIYGNYFCFNVVTGRPGEGNAVLFRAGEIIEGVEIARELRGNPGRDFELANGPAKLCLSLNIDRQFNEHDLTRTGNLFIADSCIRQGEKVVKTKRIGISKGADHFYRFILHGNECVTRHRNNKEIIEIIANDK